MAGSQEKMEVEGIEPTSFQPWATLQTTSHPFQAPYWEFPVDEGKQENKDEERNQASIWALYLKNGSCLCSTTETEPKHPKLKQIILLSTPAG